MLLVLIRFTTLEDLYVRKARGCCWMYFDYFGQFCDICVFVSGWLEFAISLPCDLQVVHMMDYFYFRTGGKHKPRQNLDNNKKTTMKSIQDDLFHAIFHWMKNDKRSIQTVQTKSPQESSLHHLRAA